MEEKVTKIQYRQDSKENWASINPILDCGEPGYEINDNGVNRWKLGDGVNKWNDLQYQDPEIVPQPVDPESVKITQYQITSNKVDELVLKSTFNYKIAASNDLISVEGDLGLPLKANSPIELSKVDNVINIGVSEQFSKDFNYLNRQAQVFVEDFDDFASFKEALTEFKNTDGLEILGFKVKTLNEHRIAYYNFEFNTTEGTIKKELKTKLIVKDSRTYTVDNFNYDSNENSFTLLLEDTECPASLYFVNADNTTIKVTPKTSIETNQDGFLSIFAPGNGYGSATFTETIESGEAIKTIDDMFRFTILGMDKSGVMKK